MRTSISVVYMFPPSTIIITKLLNAILKCISKKVLYHTSRVKTLKCLACSHFAGNRMQAAEAAAETPGGLTSARKLLSHFAPKPSSSLPEAFFPRAKLCTPSSALDQKKLPRQRHTFGFFGSLLKFKINPKVINFVDFAEGFRCIFFLHLLGFPSPLSGTPK